ncbi:mechanosensitive ion channel family protein [Niallia sp. Krafla_26]|uniref:mechanosensitive ion channel family protein n=1 Tax=Niallia sp. Krafla_26 TaxID=3064703 RepID=UPI003D1675A0
MTFEIFTSEYLTETAIAIGIFLVFLLLRKIFAKYVFDLLLRVSKKAKTTLLTAIFTAFEKPVQWVFIVIGLYAAVRYSSLLNHADPLFLNMIRSGIVIFISWGLYNLTSSTSRIFDIVTNRYDLEIDKILIPFMSRILRVIIVLIAISVIAQEFGYNVTSFVAGLGIGGLAISLAAKDALANLFGGFVIITEKPFTIGDWIKTPAVEGTVEEITFRSTRIRTFADAIVTVPNATLSNDSIINWSKMGKRQIQFQLNVLYNTSKEQLEHVVSKIKDLLVNHPGVHKETILVSFDQYQENGYGIFIYFFTETTVWAEFLKVKEDVNFNIMEILEQEGVKLAIPSRNLSLEQDVEQQFKKGTLHGS